MHHLPRNLHPSQLEILPRLGFEIDAKQSGEIIHWKGYGLTLMFASDQEITRDLAMRRTVEQAGAQALHDLGQLLKRKLGL
ncbi:hypothetical protein GCM10023213_14120 [Prosthecobacter algae]|uniref:Uncharacterized protein n=2 Tax=Prosthecobacter algae TaxID=1144682 RepID=A0ABP9NYY8_9BACT